MFGLTASLTGALVVAASGCSAPTAATAVPPAPPTSMSPTPAATPSTAAKSAVTATPGATPVAAAPTARPAGGIAVTVKVEGPADLAVVKGASPADITRAAVEAIGGIRRFVKAGQTVVVKPNVCTALAPEYGATTNPEIVATLIELCRSAGAAKVKVLDYAWGSNSTGYAVSGIEAAVKQAGGEIVMITPLKWKKTEFPNAKNLKSQEVFEDVLTADVLINVPIAKNHGLSTLTLGMKNLMGVVRSREVYHSAFGRNLTDLATVIRPAFTLVDAVRIMTRNGPGGGSLDYVEKRDTVIASTDIVAVDAYATTLFGFKPDKLESVRQGQADGLGTYDLASLKVSEIKL
jgi:uncharacterized protein (DUF362 family)